MALSDILTETSLTTIGGTAAVATAGILYTLWLSAKFSEVMEKIQGNREENGKSIAALSERIARIEVTLHLPPQEAG